VAVALPWLEGRHFCGRFGGLFGGVTASLGFVDSFVEGTSDGLVGVGLF
jgi:hypothetical protein